MPNVKGNSHIQPAEQSIEQEESPPPTRIKLMHAKSQIQVFS